MVFSHIANVAISEFFPRILFAILLLVPFSAFLRRCRRRSPRHEVLVVGFFHPYCDAGGGGERVLWCAIRALSRLSERRVAAGLRPIKCIVYTGDSASSSSILARAHERFAIKLNENDVEIARLQLRFLVEASTYPAFTLLGQSLGSIVLGLEALVAASPEVWIDTMGYAFAYPAARILGGCKVAAYVHYPTISTDMLNLVYERRPSYNNAAASSFAKSSLKYVYYVIFAKAYSVCGRFASAVMCNSSWTAAHIEKLWRGEGEGLRQRLRAAGEKKKRGRPSSTRVVYPPCDVSRFAAAGRAATSTTRRRTIVSVAQFRPEKDHRRQLDAFRALRRGYGGFDDVTLVLIGSCRNASDEGRVADLERYRARIGLPEESVVFRLNVTFDSLLEELANSLLGIHTMWNEHFGIGVVEMMAAGCIPVAHDSGGPKSDIVDTGSGRSQGGVPPPRKEHEAAGESSPPAVPCAEDTRTGYLAKDPEEYARAMAEVLRLSMGTREDQERLALLRRRAVDSTARFSEHAFERDFLAVLHEEGVLRFSLPTLGGGKKKEE